MVGFIKDYSQRMFVVFIIIPVVIYYIRNSAHCTSHICTFHNYYLLHMSCTHKLLYIICLSLF